MPVSLRSRGFQGLLWSQALGAFNDNAFKTLVSLMALSRFPAGKAAGLIAAAGGLFILPFLLFSTFAGGLTDRLRKRRLIVVLKAVELALLALGFLALRLESVPLLLGLLFLMGAHSAFFSPVKLAALPDILDESDLSNANGLVQMTSFLGILAGTIAAGSLFERWQAALHWAALPMMGVSAAGLLLSLWVPDPEPAGGGPLRMNFLADALDGLREVRSHPGIRQAVAGASYFWFLAAVFQMNVFVYGKELMGASPETLTLLQVVTAMGIGLGSWLAGSLSRDQVELGLVPLGAFGLFAFSLLLAFSFRLEALTMISLLLLGASGGCFVVPLQAYLQDRSPREKLGRFLAVGNILAFSAMFLASGALWAFQRVFRLHSGQVFLVVSLMTLAVAVHILRLLPEFLFRLMLYPVANFIYRIRVEGRSHVPLRGAALMVSNHVSFIDALLIGAAAPRPVRFLIYRTYCDIPVLGRIFRAMGCIPISHRDGPRAMIKSLEAARKALGEGELLCIFGEGEITRHGQMQGFKKGFERITRGMSAPIIPVHLDRIWGSIFSFEGGRVILKWPRELPYPVTVSFGRPMPSGSTAHQVRQTVLELGAEAFGHRLAERKCLPLEFLLEVRRHPFRFAMADSSGKRFNFIETATGAYLLGLELDKALPEGPAALLLPPCAAAVLANVGLSMMGRLPINLNYTASPEMAVHCVRQAKAAGIVTSRAFLKKLGWEPVPGMVFLEDAVPRIKKKRGVPLGAAFVLLPQRLSEMLFLRKARAPLDSPATVIFTSGSTGIPKGVVLSHANILSNLEAVGQVHPAYPSDRMLGVLPFFHSFGYTVTLWFPLIAGFGSVYHPNPMDALRVGELARRHRATLLLGTPTFLGLYLRRIEAGDFKTLRCVIVGAEKLRPEVASAFEEKFGVLPLEGYGCTELSPVAALNVPDVETLGVRQKGGKAGTIGRPLPGVTIEAVSPETGAPLPAGEAGLLLVKGPNVMRGYLDDPGRTEESLRGGFYVTGDIGVIDDDGFITVTDRLSRFSKIGGEMVPHVRVEEALHGAAGVLEQSFVVSSVPDDDRGERLVVLYKGYDDIDGLHRALQASSLPRLWIPGREDFHRVEEFPLLGSGKLDLRKLKEEAGRRGSGGVGR